MEKKNIAVVGAGLVGSLLSCYLAKRGHKVSIYERRPDMRKGGAGGGRSINLAISDRGFKALAGVGLEEKIREICIPMKGRMMHAVDGTLTFQAYGREDQAINSVSRAKINMVMMDLAEEFDGVEMHFEQRCRSYDLDAGRLEFEDASGARTAVSPDLIFGADGAYSSVRATMQRQPRFNYCQDYLEHAYKELSIPPTADGGFRMEKHALHIWPRRSFMLIALPNLDGSFTCTLFAPFEGENGFENLMDNAAVEAYFEKHFPDAKALMPTLTEDFFENPTATLMTVKCSPWTMGNAALIGDSAHAIVPFYGQGMNSGFEDCRVLAEIIDTVEARGFDDSTYADSWEEIFYCYREAREINGAAIADLAKYNFIEMRDKVADPKFLLRKRIAAHVSERHPEFIPVYSMVTFSHIPYAEAWAELERQNRVFDRILALPDIEKDWQEAHLEQIEAWLLAGAEVEG